MDEVDVDDEEDEDDEDEINFLFRGLIERESPSVLSIKILFPSLPSLILFTDLSETG